MPHFTTLLLLLAFAFALTDLRAAKCDQNLLIAYDHLTGRLTRVTTNKDTESHTDLTEDCIKYGGFIVLRVDNLNTFLYTVSVDGRAVSLNVQVPSVFAQLSQTPQKPTDDDDAADRGSGVRAESAKDFNQILFNFRRELFRAYTRAGADAELSDLVHYSDGSTRDQIVARAKTALETRFEKRWSQLIVIPSEIIQEGTTSMNGVDNWFSELDAAYKVLEENLKAKQADVARALEARDRRAQAVQQMRTQLAQSPEPSQADRDRLNALEERARIARVEWEALNGEVATQTAELGGLRVLLDGARDTHQKFTQDRQALIAKFENARSIFIMIRDAEFTVNSPAIQASGDQIEFSLKIQRNAQLDAKFPTVRVVDRDPFLTFDVRDGIKLDFSAGVFVTNVRDQAYSTETIDGVNIIRRSGDEDSARVVAGALMHVYRKKHPWVNWAGSFGLGITGDSNLSYFFGVSSLFGRESRGVLSVGTTLGSVERLSGGLSVGDEFEGTNPVPTKSTLKFGFFVGFTFNFASATR